MSTGAGSRSIAVVGGGTMGRGIAIASLDAGFDVALVDVAENVLESARARVSDYVNRHPRSEHDDRPPRGRLRLTTDLADIVTDVDVVIEAVPEVAELKLEIFGQLKGAPAHALLVSNTSTMSITMLAEACASSARVVGMHFFNPAHRMPLVEVIVAGTTSDATRDDAVALARALGKSPVVVRDVPGFITSRLGLLFGTEAMRMVEEGVASAADVDAAMRLGYGHPMGPLELADLVGLDARLNNLRSMHARSGSDLYAPPEVLESLVGDGHLGRKSGRGFFTYDEHGAVVEEAGA